jgi:hypothetical protein
MGDGTTGTNPTLSAKLHPYRHGESRYFSERGFHGKPDTLSRCGLYSVGQSFCRVAGLSDIDCPKEGCPADRIKPHLQNAGLVTLSLGFIDGGTRSRVASGRHRSARNRRRGDSWIFRLAHRQTSEEHAGGTARVLYGAAFNTTTAKTPTTPRRLFRIAECRLRAFVSRPSRATLKRVSIKWRIRGDDGMVPPEGHGLAFIRNSSQTLATIPCHCSVNQS